MLIEPRWCDAVLTWLGALGVFRYLLHIERNRRRSFLEGRTRFLLACLGALLLVRGFFWLNPSTVLHRLTFVPATLLPLAMLLFTEGLLRRHLPRAMKVFVLLGTLGFFTVNLTDPQRQIFAYSFMTFLALTLALLSGFLLLRERASLSPPENRFIGAVSQACAIALALSVTDFRTVLGFPPVRLGSLGALAFVYACVSVGARTGERLREAVRLGLRTAALGFSLFLVSGRTSEHWLPSFALAFAFTLLLATWDRLWELAEEARERSFLQWLLAADVASLPAFLGSLHDCPVAEEHVTLSREQLGSYDVAAMAARLAGRKHASSRASLEPSAGSHVPSAIEGDEQLLALLETYGMSHVCLASLEPPVLLLMNYPEHAEGGRAEIEMALVQKLALAIRR